MSLIFSLSRYVQVPLGFDYLKKINLHLEEEYRGLCRNQMERIQYLRQKKRQYTLYHVEKLARFAIECGGALLKSQLVKFFGQNLTNVH